MRVNEAIHQTNVVWKSKKRSIVSEKRLGVGVWAEMDMLCNLLWQTFFHRHQKRKVCIRTEHLHYAFHLFSVSYTLYQRVMKVSLPKGKNKGVVLVYISQTWESKLLLMQMGALERRVKLKQSSAQVVDWNRENQQGSHLVWHSYFKGEQKNPFQQINVKDGYCTAWCQTCGEDRAMGRCHLCKIN